MSLQKIAYYNDRTSRSEIARAYGLSFHRRIDFDPDVVGYRILLSPEHPRADQCDLITNVDNGCGAGVYKKGDGPTVPIHPHCLCMMEPYVDRGQDCSINVYSNKAAKEYLSKVDDKKRGQIIGVHNSAYKSRWDTGLVSKGVSRDQWRKINMLPKTLVKPVQ